MNACDNRIHENIMHVDNIVYRYLISCSHGSFAGHLSEPTCILYAVVKDNDM